MCCDFHLHHQAPAAPTYRPKPKPAPQKTTEMYEKKIIFRWYSFDSFKHINNNTMMMKSITRSLLKTVKHCTSIMQLQLFIISFSKFILFIYLLIHSVCPEDMFCFCKNWFNQVKNRDSFKNGKCRERLKIKVKFDEKKNYKMTWDCNGLITD